MSRPFGVLLLTWAGLMLLLAVEVAGTLLFGLGNAAPFIGLLMAGLIATFFMHADEGPGLIRVFALAGAFWLCVLLGLGSLDAVTRVDHPVVMRTPDLLPP